MAARRLWTLGPAVSLMGSSIDQGTMLLFPEYGVQRRSTGVTTLRRPYLSRYAGVMTTSSVSSFDLLQASLTARMRMSHVYPPLMLKKLIQNGGWASTRDIAASFLADRRGFTWGGLSKALGGPRAGPTGPVP